MSATTNVLTEVKYFNVQDIETLYLNPNVMDKEKFDALLADMEQRGPQGIDPIEIAEKLPAEAFPGSQNISLSYVCVNGNHRLKAARKLKWKVIPAIVNRAIKNEQDLISENYRKNVERGTTDAFGEARVFKYYADLGWSHEKIAKELSVGDRSQVSHRLALLKVEPQVYEKVSALQGLALTPSQWEIVGSGSPEVQKSLADEFATQSGWKKKYTEKEVVQLASRAREQEKEKQEFLSAVAKSKFKTCPKCKKEACDTGFEGLPNVQCANFHEWNLNTGKSLEYGGEEERPAPKNPDIPQYIRTEHPLDEFLAAWTGLAKEAMKDVQKIENLRLDAKAKNGADILLEINPIAFDNSRYSFTYHDTQKNKSDFVVEKKDYSQPDLKKFKTAVQFIGSAPSKKALENLSEHTEEMLKKYNAPKEGGLTKEEIEGLKNIEKRLKQTEHTGQARLIARALEVLGE